MASKKAKGKRAARKDAGQSKSDFIRAHAHLPNAELLARAKEAGISMSQNLVYAVRARLRAAEAPGAEAPLEGGRTASDFIREQLSKGLSAGDIMKAGAAAGLKFSANLVYAVRGKVSAGGGGRRERAVRAEEGGDEIGFKRLAADLGLRHSRELLDELERDLRQLLQG